MGIENFGVAILTYNAEPWARQQIAGLQLAGVTPDQVLVVDSSSRDGTAQIFRDYGAQVVSIPQSSFNHGGTRRLASEQLADRDIVVFVTQDAIPADASSIKALLSAFEDPTTGMAFGRQLPRAGATAIEAHARLFNYPETSARITQEDAKRIGSKVIFASDSFSAYRMDALRAVGGFPEDVIFAEDQIVAARMLLAGYSKAYVGEARVYHSHRYTLTEDFKRYFDAGVFHARNRWLTETFGRSEGEGLRFVKSELSFLLRTSPFRLAEACIRTFAKYCGYRTGMAESSLPLPVKRKLSASPYYWIGDPAASIDNDRKQ